MLVVSQRLNRHGFWEYMFCRQRIREPPKWKHIISKAREREKDIGRSRVHFNHNTVRYVEDGGLWERQALAIYIHMRSQIQNKGGEEGHKWSQLKF